MPKSAAFVMSRVKASKTSTVQKSEVVKSAITDNAKRETSHRSNGHRRRRHGKEKSKGSGGSLLRAAKSGNAERLIVLLDEEKIDINTSNSSGLNCLHLAAKEGHTQVVKELIKRNISINQATKRGNTALHIASLAGKLDVIKVLIENKADPNSIAQNAFTPIYMAAQEGHSEIVDYLLKNGANQSISTEDGFTPLAVALQEGKDKVVALLLDNDVKGRVKLPALHIAARKDDVKAAALLLQNDHSADVKSKWIVNRATESGFTALHIAAHYGNVSVASLLLNRGASHDFTARNGITPLHVSAKRGHTRFCSLLLDRDANMDARTKDGLSPLHCAARSGHKPVVQLLLDRMKSSEIPRTKNGLSALHMATQGGHVDVVKLLIEKNYPVDDTTLDYLTSLHIAAHCGHEKVAKLLLSKHAKVDGKALNGFTPLHVACKKNQFRIITILLNHGANTEATTESGLTPLHVACFMGHYEIVKILLEKGALLDTVNNRGETALHMATRSGQEATVKYLLDHGAHPDTRKKESQTALHLAARLDRVAIVKILIQHSAVVDEVMRDGYTPLHIASKEGHVEVCEILIEKGAAVSLATKKGFTPLHLAAKYGRLEVTNLLLKKSASPNSAGKNGLTPLHVAAHFDNQNVALLLLKSGASPQSPAKNAYTALHIAARKNQIDIAVTLLEYGASTKCKTRMGASPLHLAAQAGHTDMCSLLLAKDANVNGTAKHGLTPMHLAAEEDKVSVAKVLYDNRSLVDPLTKGGYTPLHVACHHGNINMVKYLVSLGAKVNAKTKNGYTALHLAAQQGHTQIVDLLLKFGASPNELTNNGNTALSLAKRLGYITCVDTLTTVTTEIIESSVEEKHKMNVPETFEEGFMSDASDDEEDEMAGEGEYLTGHELEELGDDSIVASDVGMLMTSRISSTLESTTTTTSITTMEKRMSWNSSVSESDNIISKDRRTSGFLVSFMVDARGGTMRGSRHPDLHVVVPPKACASPTRVTCRLARRHQLRQSSFGAVPPGGLPLFEDEGKAAEVLELGGKGTSFLDKLHVPSNLPIFNEGESPASKVLQMGPKNTKFYGPVAIEIPHFANLHGKEREIMVIRSDDGETWREHRQACSDKEFLQQVKGIELETSEELMQRRVIRVITKDFPWYFALYSRTREEVCQVGPLGGVLESNIISHASATFPKDALTKEIKVGIQVLPISSEICKRTVGTKAKASPIVTVEPRRRKFHRPITLAIPLPEGGKMKDYLSTSEASTLRLLCSISGGTDPAQWEDITGSTPLNFHEQYVSFTTTVSAKFWLIDCPVSADSIALAEKIYSEATLVPYLAKFVVLAKTTDVSNAKLRVFCLTDDRYERTLENQEHFIEVARSRDIEVLNSSSMYAECSGNLMIEKQSQPTCTFVPFQENRLHFYVKVRDMTQEPCGRLSFFRNVKGAKVHGARKPLCSLNIRLPPYVKDWDSDEDLYKTDTVVNDKEPESTSQLSVTQARDRYYLVDPSSVDETFINEDASPEEIAKDVAEVMQKLSEVKQLLDPSHKSSFTTVQTNEKSHTDISKSPSMEETSQVVTEMKNNLFVVEKILRNKQEKDTTTKQIQNDKNESSSSMKSLHGETTIEPVLPRRSDSGYQDVEGATPIDHNVTVRDITNAFTNLTEEIDYHIRKPIYEPIEDSYQLHSSKLNKTVARDHISGFLSKDLDCVETTMKHQNNSTVNRGEICNEYVDSEDNSPKKAHIVNQADIDALAEFLANDSAYSSPAEPSVIEDLTDIKQIENLVTSTNPFSSDFNSKNVRFNEKITVVHGASSHKIKMEPVFGKDSSSGQSVLQRIKAFEDARHNLEEEVEHFRKITSLESEMIHQKARLHAVTQKDHPPISDYQLKNNEPRRQEFQVKEKTSPGVVEETHSVGELLRTWESSPEKSTRLSCSTSSGSLSSPMKFSSPNVIFKPSQSGVRESIEYSQTQQKIESFENAIYDDDKSAVSDHPFSESRTKSRETVSSCFMVSDLSTEREVLHHDHSSDEEDFHYNEIASNFHQSENMEQQNACSTALLLNDQGDFVYNKEDSAVLDKYETEHHDKIPSAPDYYEEIIKSDEDSAPLHKYGTKQHDKIPSAPDYYEEIIKSDDGSDEDSAVLDKYGTKEHDKIPSAADYYEETLKSDDEKINTHSDFSQQEKNRLFVKDEIPPLLKFSSSEEFYHDPSSHDIVSSYETVRENKTTQPDVLYSSSANQQQTSLYHDNEQCESSHSPQILTPQTEEQSEFTNQDYTHDTEQRKPELDRRNEMEIFPQSIMKFNVVERNIHDDRQSNASDVDSQMEESRNEFANKTCDVDSQVEENGNEFENKTSSNVKIHEDEVCMFSETDTESDDDTTDDDTDSDTNKQSGVISVDAEYSDRQQHPIASENKDEQSTIWNSSLFETTSKDDRSSHIEDKLLHEKHGKEKDEILGASESEPCVVESVLNDDDLPEITYEKLSQQKTFANSDYKFVDTRPESEELHSQGDRTMITSSNQQIDDQSQQGIRSIFEHNSEQVFEHEDSSFDQIHHDVNFGNFQLRSDEKLNQQAASDDVKPQEDELHGYTYDIHSVETNDIGEDMSNVTDFETMQNVDILSHSLHAHDESDYTRKEVTERSRSEYSTLQSSDFSELKDKSEAKEDNDAMISSELVDNDRYSDTEVMSSSQHNAVSQEKHGDSSNLTETNQSIWIQNANNQVVDSDFEKNDIAAWNDGNNTTDQYYGEVKYSANRQLNIEQDEPENIEYLHAQDFDEMDDNCSDTTLTADVKDLMECHALANESHPTGTYSESDTYTFEQKNVSYETQEESCGFSSNMEVEEVADDNMQMYAKNIYCKQEENEDYNFEHLNQYKVAKELTEDAIASSEFDFACEVKHQQELEDLAGKVTSDVLSSAVAKHALLSSSDDDNDDSSSDDCSEDELFIKHKTVSHVIMNSHCDTTDVSSNSEEQKMIAPHSSFDNSYDALWQSAEFNKDRRNSDKRISMSSMDEQLSNIFGKNRIIDSEKTEHTSIENTFTSPPFLHTSAMRDEDFQKLETSVQQVFDAKSTVNISEPASIFKPDSYSQITSDKHSYSLPEVQEEEELSVQEPTSEDFHFGGNSTSVLQHNEPISEHLPMSYKLKAEEAVCSSTKQSDYTFFEESAHEWDTGDAVEYRHFDSSTATIEMKEHHVETNIGEDHKIYAEENAGTSSQGKFCDDSFDSNANQGYAKISPMEMENRVFQNVGGEEINVAERSINLTKFAETNARSLDKALSFDEDDESDTYSTSSSTSGSYVNDDDSIIFQELVENKFSEDRAEISGEDSSDGFDNYSKREEKDHVFINSGASNEPFTISTHAQRNDDEKRDNENIDASSFGLHGDQKVCDTQNIFTHEENIASDMYENKTFYESEVGFNFREQLDAESDFKNQTNYEIEEAEIDYQLSFNADVQDYCSNRKVHDTAGVFGHENKELFQSSSETVIDNMKTEKDFENLQGYGSDATEVNTDSLCTVIFAEDYKTGTHIDVTSRNSEYSFLHPQSETQEMRPLSPIPPKECESPSEDMRNDYERITSEEIDINHGNNISDALKLHFAQCIDMNSVYESARPLAQERFSVAEDYMNISDDSMNDVGTSDQHKKEKIRKVPSPMRSKIPVALPHTLPRTQKVKSREDKLSDEGGSEKENSKKSSISKGSRIPVRRSVSQPINVQKVKKSTKSKTSEKNRKTKQRLPSLSRSSSGGSISRKSPSPNSNRLWFSPDPASSTSSGEKYIALRSGVYTYKGSPEEQKNQIRSNSREHISASQESLRSDAQSSPRDSVASVVFNSNLSSPSDFVLKETGTRQGYSNSPFALHVQSPINVTQPKSTLRCHNILQEKPTIVKSPIENLPQEEVPVQRRTQELQAISIVSTGGVEEVLEFTSSRSLMDQAKFRNTNPFLCEGLDLRASSVNVDPGTSWESSVVQKTEEIVTETCAVEENKSVFHTSVAQSYEDEHLSQSWEYKIQDADEETTKTELQLRQISSPLGLQWIELGRELGVREDQIWEIQKECQDAEPGQRSFCMLMIWQDRNRNNPKADEELKEALQKIGRQDLVNRMEENADLPSYESIVVEKRMLHDNSVFGELADELGSPHSAHPHISSPYPFTPDSQLRNGHHTPENEENKVESKQPAPLYSVQSDDEDDPNKPHFVYVQEDLSSPSKPDADDVFQNDGTKSSPTNESEEKAELQKEIEEKLKQAKIQNDYPESNDAVNTTENYTLTTVNETNDNGTTKVKTTTIIRTMVIDADDDNNVEIPEAMVTVNSEDGRVIEVTRQVTNQIVQESNSSDQSSSSSENE
ncbi:uncharacterized protein LOC120344592 isoform X2 [Styela clava]